MSTSIVQRFGLAGACLFLYSLGLVEALAHEGASPDARAKDQAAIASVMQSLVKSIEARDAKRLAALWTTEGEFENARGVEVHGQEALEKAFAALFAKTPEVTAELRYETERFLSTDAAIAEGTVIIQRGPTQPTTDADYTALLVRECENR